MAKMKVSSGFDTRRMGYATHRPTEMTHGSIPPEQARIMRGHFPGMSTNHLSQANFRSQATPQVTSRHYPDWTLHAAQHDQAHVVYNPFVQPHKAYGDPDPDLEKHRGLTQYTQQIQRKDAQHTESMHPDAMDSVESELESEPEEVCQQKRKKSSKQNKQPQVVQKTVCVADLDDYWYWMFDALTQKGLKIILHAWISSCHPRKQTLHPYKGNGKESRSDDTISESYNASFNSGYYTAPEYWPNQDGWYNVDYTACRHLEPYHIYKNERLFLARHLLLIECEKGDEYSFNLDALKRSTSTITERNSSSFSPDASKHLEAIYAAAEKWKQFKDPNFYIDPSTKVTVYMTKQKKYQVKPVGGKRSGRDYFYGPSAGKRRHVKARLDDRDERSQSTSSGPTEVKDEATSSTVASPAMDLEEEDGPPVTTSPTPVVNISDNLSRKSKQSQTGSDSVKVCSENIVKVHPKQETAQVGLDMFDNLGQAGQLWQAPAAHYQFDHSQQNTPLSASASSSFSGVTAMDSESSGSYSPHAAGGFNYDTSCMDMTPGYAQAYPVQTMRTMSTPGFIHGPAGAPNLGPQQAWNGFVHDTASMVPVNQFDYGRNSVQSHPPHFTPWGADFAHAY